LDTPYTKSSTSAAANDINAVKGVTSEVGVFTCRPVNPLKGRLAQKVVTSIGVFTCRPVNPFKGRLGQKVVMSFEESVNRAPARRGDSHQTAYTTTTTTEVTTSNDEVQHATSKSGRTIAPRITV